MENVPKVLRRYIKGVAHIGYVVPELAAAIDEFQRVYGLVTGSVRLVPEAGEDAETRFAFFSIGGLEFELIEPVSPAFREQLLGMNSGGAGLNHIAWRVTDIEGALATLAEHDVRPGHVTPDGIVRIGDRKMVYLDPASTGGHVIELLEYPE